MVPCIIGAGTRFIRCLLHAVMRTYSPNCLVSRYIYIRLQRSGLLIRANNCIVNNCNQYHHSYTIYGREPCHLEVQSRSSYQNINISFRSSNIEVPSKLLIINYAYCHFINSIAFAIIFLPIFHSKSNFIGDFLAFFHRYFSKLAMPCQQSVLCGVFCW